jgi:hypothetical protein
VPEPLEGIVALLAREADGVLGILHQTSKRPPCFLCRIDWFVSLIAYE